MALKLWNTLGRAKQQFKPKSGNTVKLYTCGPTVYKSQHIGNYRTFLSEDFLKRTLLMEGYHVRHIMNITDVGHLVSDADEGEDKIEREARYKKKSARDIARAHEQEFVRGLEALNVCMPSKLVRATEHIKEQIALIQKLEKKGVTYRTHDGIYFDTSKIKNYGALAPHRSSTIRAGTRVAKGGKKHDTDFALWKFSPTTGPRRQLEWQSPWGTGFPGWHIECSAMSMKYLGPTLDIHCGGIEHAEIHHPNEIAQSETVTGKIFSRFWLHGAHLIVQGKKMAKSSQETTITLGTLRARGFDPLDLRYLALGTHYRKMLSFSWDALSGARSARFKILEIYPKLSAQPTTVDKIFEKQFLGALSDDLNTPRALAIFWEGIKKGASQKFVARSDKVLGLAIKKNASARRKESAVPQEILALAREREASRAAKDWPQADKIRKKIRVLGFNIEDTLRGPAIHKI
jgi:cysteinyl-tRNA synthetase